jgi:hypothetical protein
MRTQMWNKQTWPISVRQRDNKINQHHEVALRAGNGSVLPRRLYGEYIYAASCSSNRQERENFTMWNSLAAFTAATIIMGWGGGVDFNCVMTNTDCTGNMKFSKALDTVVRGFSLVDMWETSCDSRSAHCTSHGAARFDRIYVTSNLSIRKVVGVETVVEALPDHLTVCLRIKLGNSLLQGRGLWKVNTKPLENM